MVTLKKFGKAAAHGVELAVYIQSDGNGFVVCPAGTIPPGGAGERRGVAAPWRMRADSRDAAVALAKEYMAANALMPAWEPAIYLRCNSSWNPMGTSGNAASMAEPIRWEAERLRVRWDEVGRTFQSVAFDADENDAPDRYSELSSVGFAEIPSVVNSYGWRYVLVPYTEDAWARCKEFEKSVRATAAFQSGEAIGMVARIVSEAGVEMREALKL